MSELHTMLADRNRNFHLLSTDVYSADANNEHGSRHIDWRQ